MSSTPRPKVLLADDHLLVAEALKRLLETEYEVVGVVGDGSALLEAADTLRPDAIVADISMPELNGIDALVRLRQQGCRAPVVFLTMHRDATFARRAMEAGAAGYVLKHAAPVELLVALRAALSGRTYLAPQLTAELLADRGQGGSPPADPIAGLTLRQREVIQLVAEGRSTKEIAVRLSISARTVEFHKYHAMETLQLGSSAELIRFAIKHGLIEL